MNPAETSENLSGRLQAFREEIELILLAELEIEKGTMSRKVAGQPEVKVGDLTPVDMTMWQKIKDKTITRDDIKAYAAEFETVQGAAKEDAPNIPATRSLFRNILNTRANAIMVDREMDRIEREDR